MTVIPPTIAQLQKYIRFSGPRGCQGANKFGMAANASKERAQGWKFSIQRLATQALGSLPGVCQKERITTNGRIKWLEIGARTDCA
jgi:hypothetical protein